MTSIVELKARLLDARKVNDVVAKELLSTLVGEASQISEEDFKAGIKTPTNVRSSSVLSGILQMI